MLLLRATAVALLLLLQFLCTATSAASVNFTSVARDAVANNKTNQLPRRCTVTRSTRVQQKMLSMRSRWSYKNGRCSWFRYYGDELNSGNVFLSRSECHNFCVLGIQDPCNSSECTDQNGFTATCHLMYDVDCIAAVRRKLGFGPAGDAGKIEEEIRMGKLNNASLFEEQCLPPAAYCKLEHVDKSVSYRVAPAHKFKVDTPAYCRHARHAGRCEDETKNTPRDMYYYRAVGNECKYMKHFGCGGGRNLFHSMADCYNTCAV